MFIDGFLKKYHVGFHFTVFLTIFKMKSYEFFQRKGAYVVCYGTSSSLLLIGPV